MLEHSGGVQEIVVNLAKGLEAKGHKVKIITPKPSGYKADVPDDYILLGTSKRLNGTFATVLDVAIEVDGDEIDRVLAQENFDVINFHEPWVPVLARQIATRSTEAAHVATFHASMPDSMAKKSVVSLLAPYGKSVTERMHLLTATGPAAAEVLLHKSNETKISPELISNLKYIPCGVDLSYFKPFKTRQPLSGRGTKTIVYIGRPDKRKGIDYLLLAFKELKLEMPAAHLIVAGDGARLSRLKQLVKSHKIQDVKFLGRVSEERKRELLGHADLACFPSLYGEGFGIVLLEAMAMGVPPLAGNNIGYRSVMKGHGRICLLDPEATADFANRMAVFLSDDKLRPVISDWGLAEVKQYDYPKIVSQYESAYKEAIDIFAKSRPQAETGNVKSRRKAFSWISLRRHA